MRSAARQPALHPHKNAALYRARHPAQTLLYRTIAGHFETWLELASVGQFDGQGDHHRPAAHVEQAFRKYLECGIFAHGFARVRCGDCGDDFLIAFSCKGRAVCPACNTRRMVETAAHLTDHVFPHLPVRQWVLSVPKRLRYFLQRDDDVQDAALRILMRVILGSLHRNSPGASGLDKVHIGACAFVHRFGSSLNTHVHFHCIVVDGVFEAVYPDGAAARSDQPSGIRFHPASDHDEAATALAQADCRRRLLRSFVQRGLIDAPDAKQMNEREHGAGFSLDASVRIDGDDRSGLERLLRYCARPPFAMGRLHPHGPDQLLYHCPKPQPGGKCADLLLTPLELIDRIAALVPPPRRHRLRYFGALAPNSPLRNIVTALARGDSGAPGKTPVAGAVTAVGSSARYAWAALIARIYEVFPLLCLHCGGQMRIIAFITTGAEVAATNISIKICTKLIRGNLCSLRRFYYRYLPAILVAEKSMPATRSFTSSFRRTP